MKKIALVILTLLITILSFIGVNYYLNINKEIEDEPKIKQENVNNDLEPETGKYIDNNPIKLGLYKYYGRNKDRELIKEFNTNWQYHQDISSFEVYFTEETLITGKNQIETYDLYKLNYENIEEYKIGYHISFLTNEKEINKTILSPKDTEEFYEYLEIYLYDDYHRTPGVWYSHTTEEEYNEGTILTSIKLTSGKLIKEITSDITLTAFTYDNDDFDELGNYKGISKYTLILKNNNV